MIPRTSLKQIEIQFRRAPPINHNVRPASTLLPSSPQTDHLCLAIHTLTQSTVLTSLNLVGPLVISPSLFWPDTQTSGVPFWPNLRRVRVDFSMINPEGDWYFSRSDPDERDSTEDETDGIESDTETSSSSSDTGSPISPRPCTIQTPDPDIPDSYNEKAVKLAAGWDRYREFRSRADPSKLDPLFRAAARAGAQMPKLQCMKLKTNVRGLREFDFSMTYSAPNEQAGFQADPSESHRPRLQWVIGISKYEPQQDVLEIWRSAKGEVLQSVVDN